MFQGEAKKAIDLYSSAFKDLKVGEIENYEEGEQLSKGSFKLANISFAGHELIIFYSPPVHDFSLKETN